MIVTSSYYGLLHLVFTVATLYDLCSTIDIATSSKMARFTEYLHNSIELDSLVIHYLSTDNGRQQLNDFIQNEKWSIAVHFQQVPLSSQLVLLFLCDPSQIGLVKSTSRDLQEETSTKSQPLKVSVYSRQLNANNLYLR